MYMHSFDKSFSGCWSLDKMEGYTLIPAAPTLMVTLIVLVMGTIIRE